MQRDQEDLQKQLQEAAASQALICGPMDQAPSTWKILGLS